MFNRHGAILTWFLIRPCCGNGFMLNMLDLPSLHLLSLIMPSASNPHSYSNHDTFIAPVVFSTHNADVVNFNNGFLDTLSGINYVLQSFDSVEKVKASTS